MNMISRKLIVVLLAVMLFTSACGQGNVVPAVEEYSPAEDLSGQEGNEAIAEDGSIELSNSYDENIEQAEEIPVFTSIIFETDLEENSTATAIISPEGGSLTTTAADGTQYTLVVPEGALLYEEEISMTPIASAVGEVIGDSFLGGVKLDPEGLHFLELVSIEVVKPGIKEGAFGFTGQSEEQDFHMIPSTSGDGSVTITTTHFTEFVISQDVVDGIFEMGELASTAWLEHQLANGDESEQIAALDKILNGLINTGEQGIDVKNWESWTGDVLSFLLRSNEFAAKNKWNENTPGFEELISKMQSLIDLWFEQSEVLINELVGKCIQGEIVYAAKIFKITNVGFDFDKFLNNYNRRENQLQDWENNALKCLAIHFSWQGKVVATGSGLMSDISIGAKTSLLYGINSGFSGFEELEVESIEGFWHDTCKSQNGVIDLFVEFPDNDWNLGMFVDSIFEEITVKTKIIENVFIDCGQGLIINAHAQTPFHGAAFDTINSHRKDTEGYWFYEIKYSPGGGVVGKFEEGPISFTKEGVNYQVWQYVILSSAIPTD